MTPATFTLRRVAGDDCSTHSQWQNTDGDLLCECLERGKTMPAHPRIASGVYRLVLRREGHIDASYRHRFADIHKGVVQILVPGRQYIEFHVANRWDQLLGCVAPATVMIPPDKSGDRHWMAYESEAAYRHAYPVIAEAIEAGPVHLDVRDE